MTSWSKKNFMQNGLLQGEAVLWMVLILLCCWSIITVYSASSRMTFGSDQYWAPVFKHAILMCGGVGVAWVLHLLPCKLYKIIGLILTLLYYIGLVAAFITGQINGAARWAEVGGMKFQPNEFAKLGLVMTSAFLLSVFRDKKGVSPFGFKLAATNIVFTLLLIVTENLSTAVIIGVVMVFMAFYAQVHTKILATLGGIALAVGLGGYFTLTNIPQSTLDAWAEDDESIFHRVPTWVNRLTYENELPADPADSDIPQN